MARMLLNDLLKGSKSVMTHKRIISYYLNNSSSTIPELSKELNLSVPTIAKVIAEMCEDGYLIRARDVRPRSTVWHQSRATLWVST